MPIKSYGVTVTVGAQAIGGLTDVNFSGGDVNFIDTTNQDSAGSKTFLGGLIDGGTLDLSGHYDVADAGQSFLYGNEAETAAVVVTFSDGSTATFSGVVGKYETSNPLDDSVTFTCPVKVSGAITFAAA